MPPSSSDEIVHHLLHEDEDVKLALVERFGETRSAPTAARTAAGSAVSSSATPRRSRFWRACCTRSSPASTSRGASSSLQLPEPPKVCVTEVPLLYEVGGESRFDKVVVITAPAKLRDARRTVPRDDRDARLGSDREKAKRADFVYVNTGVGRGPRRMGRRGAARAHGGVRRLALLLAAALVVAGGVTSMLETGPAWYARLRYPLRYERDRPATRANYRHDAPRSRPSSTRRASSTPGGSPRRARSG